jgi:hypothetical protein
MTTVDTAGSSTAISHRLAPLIGREAHRLARHPVLWPIPVVVIVTSALDGASGGRTAGYWYGTVFVAVAFFSPMFVLFAANLVASGARRSRTEEMLNVTPATDTRRTLAMCLGVALPLAGVGAVAAGAMALIDSVNDIPPEDLQSVGELAQIPFVLAGRFDSGIWWMWWSTETTFEDRAPVPGEPWLHVAYLAGLCVCAAVAAVYRDRTQWRRLAVVGGPVLAATLVLGWLQLP